MSKWDLKSDPAPMAKCPLCEGRCTYEDRPAGNGIGKRVSCQRCGGTGKVPR